MCPLRLPPSWPRGESGAGGLESTGPTRRWDYSKNKGFRKDFEKSGSEVIFFPGFWHQRGFVCLRFPSSFPSPSVGLEQEAERGLCAASPLASKAFATEAHSLLLFSGHSGGLQVFLALPGLERLSQYTRGHSALKTGTCQPALRLKPKASLMFGLSYLEENQDARCQALLCSTDQQPSLC